MTMGNLTVVGLSNSVRLARDISRALPAKSIPLTTRSFPDGELYIRFPVQKLSGHVVLVQSMHPQPNRALMEAVFAHDTARQLGAQKITLVAPYLSYLRQDKRFRPGECVSNRIVARLLDRFDQVVTVDPHLHRIASLEEIFRTRAWHVTANKLIAEFIKRNHPNSILIGPDIESSQWAAAIAGKIHHKFVILKKKRYSAQVVRVKIHDASLVKGKTVVLVDDIISTGHTMLEPIKQLKRLGAKKILCMCVHGVFATDALRKLRMAGAQVIATNTIQNPVSSISVASLLAQELQ